MAMCPTVHYISPARPAVVLRLRSEQRLSAAGAQEISVTLLSIQGGRKRRLCSSLEGEEGIHTTARIHRPSILL